MNFDRTTPAHLAAEAFLCVPLFGCPDEGDPLGGDFAVFGRDTDDAGEFSGP